MRFDVKQLSATLLPEGYFPSAVTAPGDTPSAGQTYLEEALETAQAGLDHVWLPPGAGQYGMDAKACRNKTTTCGKDTCGHEKSCLVITCQLGIWCSHFTNCIPQFTACDDTDPPTVCPHNTCPRASGCGNDKCSAVEPTCGIPFPKSGIPVDRQNVVKAEADLLAQMKAQLKQRLQSSDPIA